MSTDKHGRWWADSPLEFVSRPCTRCGAPSGLPDECWFDSAAYCPQCGKDVSDEVWARLERQFNAEAWPPGSVYFDKHGDSYFFGWPEPPPRESEEP
jgi:hypothetical protein